MKRKLAAIAEDILLLGPVKKAAKVLREATSTTYEMATMPLAILRGMWEDFLHASINIPSPQLYLAYGAATDNLMLAKLAILFGANVNEAYSRDGFHFQQLPLQTATRNGAFRVTQALVDTYHANLEIDFPPGFQQLTFLDLAMLGGNVEAISLLINRMAIPDPIDLTFLTVRGHIEALERLYLNNELNRNVTLDLFKGLRCAIFQNNPIFLLALLEDPNAVHARKIYNHEDISDDDSKNSTALHVAARIGRLDMMKILLDHGADVNAKDYCHQTPLHLAVKIEDIQKALLAAKLLLDAGCDATHHTNPAFNLNDMGHYTALEYAQRRDPAFAEKIKQHIRNIQTLGLYKKGAYLRHKLGGASEVLPTELIDRLAHYITPSVLEDIITQKQAQDAFVNGFVAYQDATWGWKKSTVTIEEVIEDDSTPRPI